jgi:hypothetical protein
MSTIHAYKKGDIIQYHDVPKELSHLINHNTSSTAHWVSAAPDGDNFMIRQNVTLEVRNPEISISFK